MQGQILVVEPDRAVRDFLYEALNEEGCAPFVCSRATDACDVLRRERVIGLVVNLWLHHDCNEDMDLVELLNIVAARSLPVVAISTDSRPLEVRLTNGSTLIWRPLTMPFDLNDFLRVVSQTTGCSLARYCSESSLESQPGPAGNMCHHGMVV